MLKSVEVVLVGDPSELPPELVKLLPALFHDIETMLNADHTELDRRYRASRICDTKGFDWYAAMSLKDIP